MHGASFVADLAVVLGVAAATAVIAKRLRQPTVLGYLFAGLIVGPYIPVPLFADPSRVETLAELGVVLVMFAVGLEFRIAKLTRVLPISGVTGLVQVGFLLWCGFSVGLALGWTTVEALFLGGSLAISSTMVVTRVFQELEPPRDVREHVLGILIIQDVLAIAIIAALTAVAAGGGLEPRDLAGVLTKLGAVLAGLVSFGLLLVPRVFRWVTRLGSAELLAVMAMGHCFAIAALAEGLGYSVALGAFVGGILVAESGRGGKVEHVVAPLRDVFASVFFVSIGMSVDPLTALEHLPVALLLVAVVVLAQLFSVTVAGVLSGNGLRRSLFSGLSLGQIGEFAFIISSVGISAGMVRQDLAPILVTVAVITAFTTPIAIRNADRVVRAVDHRLPGRFHRLLQLYERWFEELRTRSQPFGSPGSRHAHALRNVAFDAAVATVVVALSLSWSKEAARWLVERTEWPNSAARAAFGVAVLLLVLPLLLGLLRNTLILSSAIADVIAPKTAVSGSGDALARRLVRSTVHLLVALAVGVPSVAILRPLAPGPFALPVLLLLLLALGILILRDVRSLDIELRSGTAAIAERLAREMGTLHPGATIDLGRAEAPRPSVTPLGPSSAPTILELPPNHIPGLESVKGWRIPERAHAVGASLAEIDLRAASGVAVVTIQRGEELISFPRGSEVLEAGDLLGMLGSPEALAAAQALLLEGPKERGERSRSPSPPSPPSPPS